MPADYGFDPARVQAFMYGTFDYLSSGHGRAGGLSPGRQPPGAVVGLVQPGRHRLPDRQPVRSRDPSDHAPGQRLCRYAPPQDDRSMVPKSPRCHGTNDQPQPSGARAGARGCWPCSLAARSPWPRCPASPGPRPCRAPPARPCPPARRRPARPRPRWLCRRPRLPRRPRMPSRPPLRRRPRPLRRLFLPAPRPRPSANPLRPLQPGPLSPRERPDRRRLLAPSSTPSPSATPSPAGDSVHPPRPLSAQAPSTLPRPHLPSVARPPRPLSRLRCAVPGCLGRSFSCERPLSSRLLSSPHPALSAGRITP